MGYSDSSVLLLLAILIVPCYRTFYIDVHAFLAEECAMGSGAENVSIADLYEVIWSKQLQCQVIIKIIATIITIIYP